MAPLLEAPAGPLPPEAPAGIPGPDDAAQPVAPGGAWELRLYVTDHTAKCVRALANLQGACAHWLSGRYHIEVVDLLENPLLVVEDQILAVPTLVRTHPSPIRKLVGDFSGASAEQLFFGLQL